MADLSRAGLDSRLLVLRQEYASLDNKIAELGFRRAAVHGAILEVQRMLAPDPEPAEANGHSG